MSRAVTREVGCFIRNGLPLVPRQHRPRAYYGTIQYGPRYCFLRPPSHNAGGYYRHIPADTPPWILQAVGAGEVPLRRFSSFGGGRSLASRLVCLMSAPVRCQRTPSHVSSHLSELRFWLSWLLRVVADSYALGIKSRCGRSAYGRRRADCSSPWPCKWPCATKWQALLGHKTICLPLSGPLDLLRAHRFLRSPTCGQQHAASLWKNSQHRSACLITKVVATDRLAHAALVHAAAMRDSTVQLVAMVQTKRTPSSVSLERDQENRRRVMIVSTNESKFNATLGLTQISHSTFHVISSLQHSHSDFIKTCSGRVCDFGIPARYFPGLSLRQPPD
jgi:hypothetical protein